MITLLDAASALSILLLVSAGLLLILGLMGVINLAHPGLMAVGGYGALEATRMGIHPWIAIALGALVAGAVGLLLEVTLVRRLYHRPLDTILATWGVALVTWQVLMLLFGRAAFQFDGPVQGILHLGPFAYSSWRMILIALAVLLTGALFFLTRFTRVGLVARAVMANRDLSQGLGLNTRAVQVWTFTIGSFLAGAAGALLAPLSSVNPFLGLGYLIPAFLAVLLAGRSVIGFVIAAAIVSTTQVVTSFFVNQIAAGIVVVLVAVALLRLMPNGFDRLKRVG